jgi:AcrR family transcriptional regulator
MACDESEPSADRRGRIIDATFSLLMERGYAGANTLEIARRAHVSKRELYAFFGSKDGILAAMISSRAERMRAPLSLPEPGSRAALAETLARFGVALVSEAARPAVLALFRLAVAEAERSPALAHALEENGREPTRQALVALFGRARESGLVEGAEPERMAERFLALLWGDLFLRLLMRLALSPSPADIECRAREAVAAFLALYAEKAI